MFLRKPCESTPFALWKTVARPLLLGLACGAAVAALGLAGPPAAAGALPLGVPEAKEAALAPAPAGSYVAGEIIVEFGAAVGRERLGDTARALGGRVTRRLPATPLAEGREIVVVRSTERTTDELLAAYAADPRVRRVSRNYYRRLTDVTPNDPRYGELWGLGRILAPTAWSTTTGAAGVVVAGVDSGVDYAHPDLAANMWHNPGEVPANGLDDDANGYVDDVYGIDATTGSGDPRDLNGHGSHTAGTMAAVGNNGIGVTGVLWQARIMALKFISGNIGTEADEITCINYAVNEKLAHGVNVAVINASFGGPSANALEYEAIKRAGQAGIVVCAAAGNDGVDNDGTPFYPASYDLPNIIAVAAFGTNDALAAFSNYGRQSVDLAAPGVGILSTVPNGGYTVLNGTSMATPHVSGAVALCASQIPGETAAQRAERVAVNVSRVASLATTLASRGRLNLPAVLTARAPAADDQVPGVALPASPVRARLAAGADDHDVYAVPLRAGQAFQAVLTAAASANVDLRLLAPGSASVAGGAVVAAARLTTYPDQFVYVPAQSGTYFLDVQAVKGTGRYSVAWKYDTVGPVCRATSVTVARGRTCSLRYYVGDAMAPRATTELRITTLSGSVKKKFSWGLRTDNVWRSQAWRCTLPRGTYRILVSGRDTAGNTASHVGSATLRVK